MKKFNNYLERPLSVVTSKKTELLYKFENFPLFFGCVNTPKDEDLLADMCWEIDKASGVIQLSRLIPLHILYSEQHVDGVGKTWERYYSNFANYISKQNLHKVCEIGGGKGKLAKNVLQNDTDIVWTIIEPNPIVQTQERLKVIKEFFNENTEVDNNGDLGAFVMSQVFEHIYDPQLMANQLAKKLAIGGKVIIAYPQIKDWLRNKFTNAINFEHTMLIDDFIPYIFNKAGLQLIDETKYEQHSIFYTFEKSEKKLKELDLPNLYNEYKEIFQNFISYHEQMVSDLNDKILNSKEPIYLFGAHIFSTFLFAFGLKKEITGILDNGDLKKNRRFYGTDFIVSSPQVLKNKGKVNIILRAGLYNEEIKSDILKNINNEAVFW